MITAPLSRGKVNASKTIQPWEEIMSIPGAVDIHTCGMINLRGNFVTREKPKKVDYLLYINANHPITMPTEIKFEITQHIATLSTSPKGWTKELNLVSWNDKEAKYDIREWSPDHSKMGKGVTLSQEEMDNLKKALL